MSTPTPDDVLRSALHAAAEGVTADDDLLARVRAEVDASTPLSRGRRAPLGLAAAVALAVVAIGAALLLTRVDGDEPLDLVDGAPVETTEAPEADAGEDDDPAPPATEPSPIEVGPRPDVVVGVTVDGRLVVVDVDTGEELRELWALEDPRGSPDPETGMGPQHISGVNLHPGGERAFVEVCCEPAGGNIYVVELDGSTGDPPPAYTGYGMDVSADGRWLAAVSGDLLLLHDLDDSQGTRSIDLGEVGFGYSRVAVNQDATEVALERGLGQGEQMPMVRDEVHIFRISDGDLTPVPNDDPREGRAFARYFEQGRQLQVVLNQQDDPPRSFEVDATGTWELLVLADGRLAATTRFGEARDVRIDVPTELRFIAADW